MDESEIPIDIHTSKLLDWLVSRRHVQRDWQSKVVKIREKINEAIKDMPENDEITALLTGSYINYFHCVKLVEILKETEANSKNLFGQYSSKRMKDWLEITKMYTKENIYLGEAASLLLRNVNYEVPALKKQFTRTVHLRNEYDKKESEYEKLAELNKKDFAANCKALGIKGKKVKKELMEIAANFPSINKKLADEMKHLKGAVEFYQETVNLLLKNDEEVLKMLKFIIDNGDKTVYEWKYKKAPSSVEANKMVIEEDEAVEEDVIDFGVDTDVNLDEDIDWGISTQDDSGKVENKGDDSCARGEDARSILGHPSTRRSVINDVLELEAFLKIRLHELNNDTDGMSASIYPESLQNYDSKAVGEMLTKLKNILNHLQDSTSTHYLNITTNPRYVHQLTEKLEHKLNTAEKMLASKEFVKAQRAEALKEGAAITPKIDLLIKKTKELQELIEVEISKKYNGRPVNLIAGANVL